MNLYDHKWNLCINLREQFKAIEWIIVEREKKQKNKNKKKKIVCDHKWIYIRMSQKKYKIWTSGK